MVPTPQTKAPSQIDESMTRDELRWQDDLNWEQRILRGVPLMEVSVGSGTLELHILQD